MKNINNDRPFSEDHSDKSQDEEKISSAAESEKNIDDPLEVFIEEEKDEKEQEDTQDDMFDDDELDLDPTLDRDEW